MHWTVKRSFKIFLDNYFDSSAAIKVLEIGSANVNGGLRELKLPNMDWTGVDLEPGPGVDVVVAVGQPTPFDSASFDLVVASSVFEHDIQFWNTFLEMSRVVKTTGVLLLTMPSQGNFHRYPLDAFRFYPDSGIALEKWAHSEGHHINLVESFTTRPENDIWADYVAIYSGAKRLPQKKLIGDLLEGENWIVGNSLIDSTYQELPYELRKIAELEAANISLTNQLRKANAKLGKRTRTKPQRNMKPLRILIKILKRIRALLKNLYH